MSGIKTFDDLIDSQMPRIREMLKESLFRPNPMFKRFKAMPTQILPDLPRFPKYLPGMPEGVDVHIEGPWYTVDSYCIEYHVVLRYENRLLRSPVTLTHRDQRSQGSKLPNLLKAKIDMAVYSILEAFLEELRKEAS